MENKCSSIDYYKEAIKCSQECRLRDAFEDYFKAFFSRMTLPFPPSVEFRNFFRFQLASYLAEKNNYYLGLPEGDMVSDLIQMTYDEFLEEMEESQVPLSHQGRLNLLSSIHITFPCQIESEKEAK